MRTQAVGARTITLLGAFCLGSASAVAATCTRTQSLGGLGPPALKAFGNSFSSAGTYVDCYTFSLSGGANSFGGMLSWDLSPALKIKMESVSLYSDGVQLAVDVTPKTFSFGSLAGGSLYVMQIASKVTNEFATAWDGLGVGYAGKITTIAAAVPEPEAYALSVVGLALVAAAALRSRRSKRG